MGLHQENDIWEKTWRRWGCQSRKHLWEVFSGKGESQHKSRQAAVCWPVRGGHKGQCKWGRMHRRVGEEPGEGTGATSRILFLHTTGRTQSEWGLKRIILAVSSMDSTGTGGSKNKVGEREMVNSDQILTYREGRINRISWHRIWVSENRDSNDHTVWSVWKDTLLPPEMDTNDPRLGHIWKGETRGQYGQDTVWEIYQVFKWRCQLGDWMF